MHAEDRMSRQEVCGGVMAASVDATMEENRIGYGGAQGSGGASTSDVSFCTTSSFYSPFSISPPRPIHLFDQVN